MLKHWDYGFKSLSRHECLSIFVCVMLLSVGTGPAMGQSLNSRSPTKMSERFHSFRS
jgi:hypothetical protein